jgi:hypothetical protein
MLNGYKTYLCALAIGILSALLYVGKIDQEMYNFLVGVVGAGGIAALRSAIK